MDSSILVAIITASGTILVAAITFYLTKRHQFEIEWRHEKLNHYKVLLSALSDLAVAKDEEARKRYTLAVNTIALCATQSVISALMNLNDEVILLQRIEKQDQLLKKLLLAIRKDIKLSVKDNEDTFNFHLIGYDPKVGTAGSK